jgi:hydroxymethylbilane synthase
MKDVPTMLPKGMLQAAVLPRADHHDWLIHKKDYNPTHNCVIATGSLRRKAQWLHKYAHHTVVNLRGNVNTRLQKLKDSNWSAAIFAAAGLQRIDLRKQIEQEFDLEIKPLEDILPAPAQGIIMVAAMAENTEVVNAVSKINHQSTEICATLERAFLRQLEGGCTAPIGALATVNNQTINFKGSLYSLDGLQRFHREINMDYDDNVIQKVRELADEILKDGGKQLLEEFRS